MLKVIANADDCGMSEHVNASIRACIQDGIVSSTTIMANMGDFEGAVKLYNDFHKQVSFGIHFNLTQGSPLTYSQCLLDGGFLKEENGDILFYGKSFDFRKLTEEMKADIARELKAQAALMVDAGISPSHIDSHHHVHWHREIFGIMCSMAKLFGQNKMRRVYFYSPSLTFAQRLNCRFRQAYISFVDHNIKTVDCFVSVDDFYKMTATGQYRQELSYELMIHPGHSSQLYRDEIGLLRNDSLLKKLGGDRLMTYYDL